MKEINFIEDLKFDINKLDEALDTQHIINMQYHELYSSKIEEVNNQKLLIKIKESELKEIYSKLYIKYKQENINGKNPTETMVDSLILVTKEYKDKQTELFNEITKLNKVIYESELLDGAVKSFQQRKNNLEKLCELWINGYFGNVRNKKTIKDDCGSFTCDGTGIIGKDVYLGNSINDKLNEGIKK